MVKERILEYLDNKGISKYKFYQQTGLSNGYLDKKGSIGADKCEIILSTYEDINTEWLMRGKGSMIKTNNNNVSSNQVEEPSPNYISKHKEDQWISMIEKKDNELRKCHQEIGRLKEVVRRFRSNYPNAKDVPESE